MQKVAFNPRRLGHINFWVSDIERSISFYEDVCGIELVRRERDLKMGFHSNGNTHHDIGMIEISRGVDRIGRDGKVQIPASRGTSVGLNHLGWEMEGEDQVVEAYKRALALNKDARYRTVDHMISRSVYVVDPDGNTHEFYADSVVDWREIYNVTLEDAVTAEWDPLSDAPSTARNYPVDPPIEKVVKAPLHPSHVTDATIATSRFDVMKDFFTDVAGLGVKETGNQKLRHASFSGGLGLADLTLIEVPQEAPIGLQMFSFLLAEDCDFEATAQRIMSKGAAPATVSETEQRRSIRLTDPDGFCIEFYRPR